ncbi:hypothetical protein S40285_09865 [Stachybotrys chlorohalonatus IBT 40285]|uniref:Uncharacterized protein n=1 Tax=Stachybotrys chlorohalonatus (strain IBT 40285) TaxID=1283841 RepID=A0A084QJT7_STAC4|nr:hypothetical protein S40285_09865 [Stachybotrys chlorohalonata IBT 40285]
MLFKDGRACHHRSVSHNVNVLPAGSCAVPPWIDIALSVTMEASHGMLSVESRALLRRKKPILFQPTASDMLTGPFFYQSYSIETLARPRRHVYSRHCLQIRYAAHQHSGSTSTSGQIDPVSLRIVSQHAGLQAYEQQQECEQNCVDVDCSR